VTHEDRHRPTVRRSRQDRRAHPEFNRSSQHSRFAERIVAPWFVVLDRMMSVDVASVIAEAA